MTFVRITFLNHLIFQNGLRNGFTHFSKICRYYRNAALQNLLNVRIIVRYEPNILPQF